MKLTTGLLLVAFSAVALGSHHSRNKRGQGHLRLQLLSDPQSNRDTSFLRSLDKEFVADAATHWDHFKHRFNRTYQTVETERNRFMVFLRNLHFIEQHNTRHHQGLESHEVEINHLADLTPEEYRSMNGFKRQYGDSLAKSHASTFLPLNKFISIPDSMDWREHGYVTPVKNQGMCGSCWSFSTTGALEGQHFRKTGKLVSLSEQNLVDCSTSFGNHGCNGGLMDQAFQYVKENGGIDTEESYPYEAQDDTCRFKRTEIGAKDSGFMDVTSGDEDALKQALATVGPVSIAIDASHRSFQFYKAGKVYVEPECSPQQLDHGVLAVGYGTKDGQDYWIVKNSWGPKWGDQGYIWMARNKENQCGVATAASYPLV